MLLIRLKITALVFSWKESVLKKRPQVSENTTYFYLVHLILILSWSKRTDRANHREAFKIIYLCFISRLRIRVIIVTSPVLPLISSPNRSFTRYFLIPPAKFPWKMSRYQSLLQVIPFSKPTFSHLAVQEAWLACEMQPRAGFTKCQMGRREFLTKP